MGGTLNFFRQPETQIPSPVNGEDWGEGADRYRIGKIYGCF